MSVQKKHIGKIKSTEQRCVVIFMQIPDAPEKALIVNIESLPERYEQIFMEVVNSPEGQQANDLGATLGRRMFPDTGRTVLEEFHNRGFMRAEPVDNIIMIPRPNMFFPLRDILVELGKLNAAIVAPKPQTGDDKFNQHTANKNAAVSDERLAMAMNILSEAADLEVEARRKREQAYGFAPHLRPQENVTPDEPVVLVEETKEAQS